MTENPRTSPRQSPRQSPRPSEEPENEPQDEELTRKEQLIKKNSLAFPDRKRITHASKVVVEWFMGLQPWEKFRERRKVVERNNKRKEKDMEYMRNMATEPGSPRASEWSLHSNDCEDLLADEFQLEKAKPYLEENLYQDLYQRLCDNQKGPSAWKKNSLYAPRFVEVDATSDLANDIEFHPTLVATLNYHSQSPPHLGLFLSDNLQKISTLSHQFKWDKVPPGPDGQKINVWLLSSVYQALRLDSQDPMEGIDNMHEWEQAMKNLGRLELLRDPDGADGIYVKFHKCHRNFFARQPAAPKNFELWKPVDLELRRDRFAKKLLYSEARYELRWSRVLSQIDNKKYIDDHFAKLGAAARQQYEANEKKRKSYGGRDEEDSSSKKGKPFQKSSEGGKSRGPRCVGCGHRGHKAGDHKSTDPPLIWASIDNGNLVHPTSKKPLCFRFNIYGGTTKCGVDCKSEHLCSFCGKSDHHALSGKCPKDPEDRA
ncbi:hypothetical protein PQX77_016028 [Marasmius sp. AFHP31]|nr:hypothetical protein PQX77_016028 [Marasmius sp. AFHP31]